MRALMILLLLPLAVPATAAPAAPPAVAASPARPADFDTRVQHGLALARFAQPQDIIIPQTMRQLDESLVASMKGTEQIQQIETALPGFTERYYAAARPELEAYFKSRLPQLWQAMAETYGQYLTVDEIDQAGRFFGGSVGRKVVRLANERVDARAAIDAGVKQGVNDTELTEGDRQQMKTESVKAFLGSIGSLTPAERSALATFSASPAGRAARRVGPAVFKTMTTWMSERDPKIEARMGEIALNVAAEMQGAKK